MLNTFAAVDEVELAGDLSKITSLKRGDELDLAAVTPRFTETTEQTGTAVKGRDVDRRRLALLAAMFFVVGLVNPVVAVQMVSWWMAAAGTSCAALGSLL
jgi:hypothetical protein